MSTEPPVLLSDQIPPDVDRRNGLIFIAHNSLLYFAAPVIYVGVVQGALADKLGASAFVANLPASTYLLGALAPLILSCALPHRLVRATSVLAYLVTATLLGAVCILLFSPVSDTVRLIAVIGQGLIQGFSAYTSQVYTFQCLKRGTTPEGSAWAFKWTFALGPILAVAGSLWAQFVLDGGIDWLPYPYDFAVLYLIGAPCIGLAAFLCSRYQLVDVPETEHPPLFRFLSESFESYIKDRTLVLLWVAFFMWFIVTTLITTLSLYGREVLGQDPKEYSGWIMAFRFGFKSLAGYAMGMIAIRWGLRASLYTSMLFFSVAVLWGWMVPGYFYMIAFGFMGAGELGGAYFPMYLVAICSAATSTRHMSILMLGSSLSFIWPATHGALADNFGFQAAFIFALSAALFSLILISRLPRAEPHSDVAADSK